MYTRLVTILALIGFSVGCTDSGSQHGPDQDPQSLSDNRIEGTVRLYNEYGNRVSDQAGVLVTATSTSGVAYNGVTTSDGKYVIEDVAAGVYEISASAAGYSKLTSFARSTITNQQYVGAGVLNVAELRLSKPFASDLVYEVKIDTAYWILYYNQDSTELVDSAYAIAASFKTRHTDDLLPYYKQLSEAGSSDCDDVLVVVNTGPTTISADGRRHFSTIVAFEDLKNKIGNAIFDRPFSFDIRVPEGRRPDSVSQPVDICGVVSSVQIEFSRP